MNTITHNKVSKSTHNILIVEDCKLFSDAIKTVLNLIPQNNPSLKFNIEQALDYESALNKIKKAKPKGFLDLVILDIRLGELKDGERKSGKELGVFIRNFAPETKIVVITSYSDGFRIITLYDKLYPEGFLIKNHASDHKVLEKAIVKIIIGGTYYCNTVSDILRKKNKFPHKLDDIDLKILYELSLSTKKKNLINYIPLKLRSIEKRHRRLKEIFEVENDRSLVLKAKENGFL